MTQLKHRVAVYGSLLKGLHNHVVIGRYIPDGRAKYLGEDVTEAKFSMVNLGAFPGLLPGENRIAIEIYNLSDEAFQSVRMLEGYNPNGTGLYTEKKINTAYGDAVIYMFNKTSDNWLRNKNILEPNEKNIVTWKSVVTEKQW